MKIRLKAFKKALESRGEDTVEINGRFIRIDQNLNEIALSVLIQEEMNED